MRTILKYILKLLFLFIFLIAQISAHTQTKVNPYINIDNRVKKIQATNVDDLARKLTSVYKKEREKVRAIFRWITENIGYDVKGYHNSDSIYAGFWDAGISTDRDVIEKNYNAKILEKVMREKRAICDGYSRLFKSLCDYAGIKCSIVTGYIRWSSDSIGLITNRTHAWNVVFIENSWRLIDATWASGYCNNNVTKFTKAFNDFFFFTDPIQFFNDHFPDDKTWSLLPVTPSLHNFYNYPFYYPDFYREKITSLLPAEGTIKAKYPAGLIKIELGYARDVKSFEVYEYPGSADTLNNEYYEPDYKFEKGKITCNYYVRSKAANRINIFLNGRLILSYGLKIN